MAVRITHTNNSQGHDGTYVYRSTSPMDPQALPAPIADAPPVALGATFEYIDNEATSPVDYYYRTQDHGIEDVSAVSAEAAISIPPSLSNSQIGDEIEGGIYAGIQNINGTDYYIIFGKNESEINTQWKTSTSATSGTESSIDGLANTDAMIAAGLSSHPAANACVTYQGGGYTDWHLPAISQIAFVRANLIGHPSINIANNDSWLWSSTDYSSSLARYYDWADAYAGVRTKTDNYLAARPIRRVPV